MARYSIPEDFIKGFEIIIGFSEPDFSTLTRLINELNVSEPLDHLLEKATEQIKTVSANDLQMTIQSLVSIVHIFSSANNDIERFTDDFAKSYLFSKVNSTQAQSETLKARLSLLLKHFKNLTLNVKSRDLLTENQRNFREGRVISDIRILFNNDLLSEENEAIIVHSLKIQYTENNQIKDFFVSLDFSDLKKLKATIDRAIEKDHTIKRSHTKINFLDFSNANNPSD